MLLFSNIYQMLENPFEDLPAYNAGSRNQTQFYEVDYPYSNHPGQETPWLLLRLKSMTSSNAYLPAYKEGQPIQGKVILDLSKPEKNITAVVVTVSGCFHSFIIVGITISKDARISYF